MWLMVFFWTFGQAEVSPASLASLVSETCSYVCSPLLLQKIGDPLLACRWSAPGDSRAEPHRRPPMWPPLGPDADRSPAPPSPRGGGRLGREFHALPLTEKVAILDRLTGHLLDVHSVREVSRLQQSRNTVQRVCWAYMRWNHHWDSWIAPCCIYMTCPLRRPLAKDVQRACSGTRDVTKFWTKH